VDVAKTSFCVLVIPMWASAFLQQYDIKPAFRANSPALVGALKTSRTSSQPEVGVLVRNTTLLGVLK
jgi:hypothetical protein